MKKVFLIIGGTMMFAVAVLGVAISNKREALFH